MRQKTFILTMAAVALALVSASRARAGVEMVEPESTPAPRYNYAPPPEPVYYAPPVVGVAVYPTIGFYPRPFGFYRYHRWYGRRGYWRGRHWR